MILSVTAKIALTFWFLCVIFHWFFKKMAATRRYNSDPFYIIGGAMYLVFGSAAVLSTILAIWI